MSSTSGLQPIMKTLWGIIKQMAPQWGINVQLTSGYRSTAQQASLYANRASNPYPVAPPGTSQHEYGLAIDIASNNLQALDEAWKSAGLWHSWADRIHFQYYDPTTWRRMLGRETGNEGISVEEAYSYAFNAHDPYQDLYAQQVAWSNMGAMLNMNNSLSASYSALYSYLFP